MSKPSTNTMNEEQYIDWFFKTYCENLKKLVADLEAKGVTEEQLNRDILPRCAELYNKARRKGLAEFRQLLELHELKDDSTKH